MLEIEKDVEIMQTGGKQTHSLTSLETAKGIIANKKAQHDKQNISMHVFEET